MVAYQRSLTRLLLPLVLICLLGNVTWAEENAETSSTSPDSKSTAAGIEFFEKNIRPLLANHCYECHGADEQESDLRLDSYRGMTQGGLGGSAVIPNKVNASLLITAVRYIDNDLQMPPEDKLSDSEIADLVRWVEMGAPHPDANRMAAASFKAPAEVPATEHWAFQTPKEPDVPQISNQGWSQGVIDQFILQRLESNKITPAGMASRRVLIRRATFDLIGLPPTCAEVEEFIADDSPKAFEKVVNRLLASPRYGERWGRHWLDIARYADSNGLDENIAQANAWRYRDYVVNAFNNDKSFDQFVREQVAGDLLPSDDPKIRNERLIATGFLSLGPKVLAEVDETKMEMDIVDEQIDTLGKSLLGLTLGCARCHDHKFDPILMLDYYGLAGIFKSTHTMDSFKKVARWHENPLEDKQYEAQLAEHETAIAAKQSAIDSLLASATLALQKELGEGAALPAKPEESFSEDTRQQLKNQREQIAALKKKAPEASSAMGVKEGKVVEVPIHIRGSHLTLGEIAARRIPAVFATASTPTIDAEHSGRLALAEWLTAEDNPLTARVIVNRVWRWHFGRGLVLTTDNFGVMGDSPTHAELLDWLTVNFVREGWSLKHLHKQIMLSSTYQMSSDYNAQAAEVDPQNELYWRTNIRRLEAEELRDAMLLVSGQLDETMGGPALKTKNREFVFNHTSKDETNYESKRRSIYLPVIRNHLHDSFTLFDYADASMPNGDRNTSTVASQALYMMNSEFLAEVSRNLAALLQTEDLENDSERIHKLYEITVGRSANEQEIARVLRFLKQFEQLTNDQTDVEPRLQAWRIVCQTLLMSNEFVYVR